MTTPAQQFCVRWNSYHSNLQNAFPKLLTSEHFVDVTLACDNGLIKCHKVVLSACSNYFENILIQNPCQHPTIVLKDMKCTEVQALVDFMYKGEVNVAQEDLSSLLKAAECLQIRGLSGSEQCLNQMTTRTQTLSIPPCPPLTPVVTTSQGSGPVSPSSPNGSSATNNSTEQNNTSHKTNGEETRKRKQNFNDSSLNDISLGDTSANCSVTDENEEKYDDSQDEDYDEHKIKLESMKEEEMTFDEDMELYLDADEDGDNHTPGGSSIQTDYSAIANVSCLYNANDSNSLNNPKRIRRSEAELKQAADCITRGQTFQNVSDQFNIPISTIRFFMARKGILPRRKRGRSSAAIGSGSLSLSNNVMGLQSNQPGGDRSGNTSPIGPPFHIVHFKLPELGPKLK